MAGTRRSIASSRLHVYDKLKSRLGKRKAARIANAGRTRSARSAMARKAARSRARRR